MKKILSLLFLLATTLSLVACGQQAASKLTSYETISLADTQQKLDQEEDFYLYIGRPTCPYCQEFSPKLEEAIEASQTKVYYLNTDEEDPTDVLNFAADADLQTVPDLRYYQKGQVTKRLENPSQAQTEGIQEFLAQESQE